jgi:succinoglycan biosynthesis transport protein ExoP
VQRGANGSNLERALGVLGRRWFWVPLCVVLAAAGAYGISKHQPTRYTATASLLFKGSGFTQQVSGLQTAVGVQAEQSNNLKLVTFGDMATKTAAVLGHGLTTARVTECLNIAEQGEANFAGEASVIDVSCAIGSPTLATYIANTYAETFVKEQKQSNSQYYKSALALVRKQLAEIPRGQRYSAVAVPLQNRAQSLKLLAEVQFNGVEVSRPAVAPTSPTSPTTKRNTMVGGVIGLVIGIGLVFLLEHLDPRIRQPEQLESIYGAPLLGVVRESKSLALAARTGGDRRFALPAAENEAFSLIFAHVRSRNAERDLRIVMIGSAEPGDGKTTIAVHLAEAAARLGTHVLLLEANLRRPTIARQLGLQPGPGLSDVLAGLAPMRTATQAIAVGLAADDRVNAPRQSMHVLAAGETHTINAGELLESQALDSVLEQARAAYDLVVIDTPALTTVSDAFSLLRRADGVVIVSSAGRDRRDVAARVRETIEGGGAPLLGVISNRSTSRSPGFFAYHSNDEYAVLPGSATVASAPAPAEPQSMPVDVS